MIVEIRQERNEDGFAVRKLVKAAFANMKESDHKEYLLVERLHKSDTFIPQLSLVAEADGKTVGYVLLTKVGIVSEAGAETSLCVAPLAVLPEYQNQGIGGRLLCEAHRIAASFGYKTGQ